MCLFAYISADGRANEACDPVAVKCRTIRISLEVAPTINDTLLAIATVLAYALDALVEFGAALIGHADTAFIMTSRRHAADAAC
jgi:hypothetical protein